MKTGTLPVIAPRQKTILDTLHDLSRKNNTILMAAQLGGDQETIERCEAVKRILIEKQSAFLHLEAETARAARMAKLKVAPNVLSMALSLRQWTHIHNLTTGVDSNIASKAWNLHEARFLHGSSHYWELIRELSDAIEAFEIEVLGKVAT